MCDLPWIIPSASLSCKSWVTRPQMYLENPNAFMWQIAYKTQLHARKWLIKQWTSESNALYLDVKRRKRQSFSRFYTIFSFPFGSAMKIEKYFLFCFKFQNKKKSIDFSFFICVLPLFWSLFLFDLFIYLLLLVSNNCCINATFLCLKLKKLA